jgi:polysaccharide export outer membrane protein
MLCLARMSKSYERTLRIVRSVFLLLLVADSAVLGFGQTSSVSETPTLQERYPRYRLRPGDTMEFTFPLTPEFNQSVAVQPDGFITLQGIGDIRVQDRTTPEVVSIVRSAYSKVLHEPIINIKLTQFEKPYFVMNGEVTHPGKYDFTGDTTVSQAVAIAGGFTASAKKGEVVVFRKVSDQFAEVKKVDIQRMLSKGDLQEDLHLRPGDMVLISKSKMSRLAKFIPIPSLGMYFNPVRY